MQLGDIANEGAAGYGKPLDGVRVLAAEQMQALPYATQLLARLGADVVKVEHPATGESGRGSSPLCSTRTAAGWAPPTCATTSTSAASGLDLKAPEGRELFLDLVPQLRRGRRELQGRARWTAWAWATTSSPTRTPRRSTSRSPGSATRRAPYRDWPAYASIVEAMSGIYEYKTPRRPAGDDPGRRARRHQLARCSRSSASWRRCATATAPARASTSTSPCSTRWSR